MMKQVVFLAVCCLGALTLYSQQVEVSSNSLAVTRKMTTFTSSNKSSIGIGKSNQSNNESSGPPKIAWLMSFPNSGTSFTLRMTLAATNSTTATNYGVEASRGINEDKPSVQAIPGKRGRNGPFLQNRNLMVPSTFILTKTHCSGYCNGPHCSLAKTDQTGPSFIAGCCQGIRLVATNGGTIKKIPVTYNASLAKKAIHIMRHPLDNIVSRFHHEKAKKDYAKIFPKNQDGFRRWCAAEDADQYILRSHFLNKRMAGIPCLNEFFRYVQWHNLAFTTSADLSLPTMVLHYNEYEEDFPKARDRVIEWLELEHVGKDDTEFHPGKVYHHYYTNEQKIGIREFLQEFSSAQTWAQLRGYDFEIQGDNEKKPSLESSTALKE